MSDGPYQAQTGIRSAKTSRDVTIPVGVKHVDSDGSGIRFLLLSAMLQVSQDYPSKPVRLIDPFGAGGGPDLIARALGAKLSEFWGQRVTVENHPGEGSTAGPALVAKSPADGYTLLLSTSAQAYGVAVSNRVPYDPLKDFIPVAALSRQPYVLVTGKSSGASTVGELV